MTILNMPPEASTEAVVQAAAALRAARAQRRPVPPISATFGVGGLDDAYAVAGINTALALEQGRRITGLKVGLTSKAVQQQLGVGEPDFGVLLDDMEVLNGETVPMARLMQPKAEAEIAFVIGRDLGSQQSSWAQFLNCVAYALPALEIVDSAIADWKITLADTVADNASCGMYVLGDQPVALGAVQLLDAGMQMTKNGDTVSVGSGAACLGHPLRAAYWLARTMAARGNGLRAGQVILSGALGPMAPVAAGDVLHARIAGVGTVSCRMV